MKIGITERGDAGIDMSWVKKMSNVDGAVLISKNFTELFTQNVLAQTKPLILHCTCTGFGGTELEPNVPDYKKQLDNLKNIIDNGFPADHCVLRVDPIFPSTEGIARVQDVLNYFMSLHTGITRIRISLVDEYRHVKERYRKHGWVPLYGDNFQPSLVQKRLVADAINSYPFRYELCAEDSFASMLRKSQIAGCISNKDLYIMGIPIEPMTTNPQNRSGYHCLSCKTELLTRRTPCPNGCVYCFWK